MNLTDLRNDTPGVQHRNHLNNAGAGLMPAPVIEAIKNHIDLEGEIGGYEAHWAREDEINAAYASAAEFLNCQPRNVAMTANATDAFARALSAFHFEPGDVILTSRDDYISNQIMYLSLQKRFGIRIERAPCLERGGIDPKKAGELIADLKPKLVAVTHVPTNSGLIQEVHAIGDLCKEFDVPYLVDACQSAGQLPLDMASLHCDYLSATMRKYLRGPRGAGFLCVSDRALERGDEPLFLDMQGADWDQADRYSPYQTARRFEDWEFPWALVLGSGAAFDYVNRVGIHGISERVIALAALLRAGLSNIDGVEVLDQGERKCGLVTLKLSNASKEDLGAFLDRRNINYSISLRNYATIDFDLKKVDWALRLSPHYYNTEAEIDDAVVAVSAFMAAKP